MTTIVEDVCVDKRQISTRFTYLVINGLFSSTLNSSQGGVEVLDSARNKELCHKLIWNDFKGSREWVRQSIYRQGWSRTREILVDSIKGSYVEWFHINKILLEIFNLSELLGYDDDVMPLLESISETRSYDMVKSKLEESLRTLICEQLTKGGSTWFFDADKMRTSSSDTLLEQLLETRKEEFGYVVNLYSKMDLSSLSKPQSEMLWGVLWATWYGQRIHRENWFAHLGARHSSLYPSLLKLNEELGNTSDITSRAGGPNLSDRLDSLLTQLWIFTRYSCHPNGGQHVYGLVATGIIEFPRLLDIYASEKHSSLYIIPELELSSNFMELRALVAVITHHLGYTICPPRVGLLWRYLGFDPNKAKRETTRSALIDLAGKSEEGKYFLERDVPES